MQRVDPRRISTGIVLVFLALSLIGSGAGGATAGAPGLVGSTQVDPDNVLLRVTLRADGTATWEVVYTLRLDDENATAAFEALREDIAANRSRFETQFEERIRPTVEEATATTGREMSIRNVTVSTSRQTIGQEYGVITYRFVWTGFARVNGSRLEAGDALEGLFLDSETSLRMSWPPAYRPITVTPEPQDRRDNAVVWHGQIEFGTGEPRLVVTTAPPPTESVTTTDGPPGQGDGLSPGLLAFGVVVALLLVGAAGWVMTRGRSPDGSDAGAGAPTDPDGAEGDDPPAELLSNEERVLRLLRERGGRMKQQDVADTLEWTDAKTSQVVSSLREDEEVDTFRIGRENVLTLPGHDLTDGRSGDDDA